MSEMGNNTKVQKPKTSKLAIASLLFAVFLLIVFYVSRSVIVFKMLPNLFLQYILLFEFISLVVAPILALIGMYIIDRNKGRLKGKAVALAGFVLAIIYIVNIYFFVNQFSDQIECQNQLHSFGKSLFQYAADNGGKYPKADKWCDFLVENGYAEKSDFMTSAAVEKGLEGPSIFAINPDCDINSPADTVLLFEAKSGWNQHEGKDLIECRHFGGFHVFMNDSNTVLVKQKDVNSLNWGEKYE